MHASVCGSRTEMCSADVVTAGMLQRDEGLLPIKLALQNDSISLPTLHLNPSIGGMSSL
jgi:hypothetical protein